MIPFNPNNGQAHTGAGTISDAYQIKSRTKALNKEVANLSPGEASQIQSERRDVIGPLRRECAEDPTAANRAAVRQAQAAVYDQGQLFQGQ